MNFHITLTFQWKNSAAYDKEGEYFSLKSAISAAKSYAYMANSNKNTKKELVTIHLPEGKIIEILS